MKRQLTIFGAALIIALLLMAIGAPPWGAALGGVIVIVGLLD